MTRIFHPMIFTALWAVMLAGLWPFASADACSCVPPPPPQEAFERADAVFAGKVKEIRKTRNGKEVWFDVSRTWKGVDQTQVWVVTGMGGGDCGYPFTAGVEHLVYANDRSGGLTTSICHRTAILDSAQEDLAALGAGSPPTRTVDLESSRYPCVLTAVVVLAMGLVLWLRILLKKQ